MSLKSENYEDESFIILGSSPGTSLDIKCNGIESGAPLDKAQMEDALKDLSMEASASYRAHFNLAECPSSASLMVASNIITDDKSTEELQKRFGEILDENVILKDTLKQNNDSLKEQFLLIASCQDDMLKTTMQHKEKFVETKLLIEKLRHENKRLKLDIAQLADSPASIVEAPPTVVNGETGEMKGDASCAKSGPSSALEFVTSPEDDTVDKLTAQLALVEKQRRQVITDNEKLTWQKESLEHIVDATTKERDDLKDKIKNVELQLSSKINEHQTEIRELNFTIDELQKKLDVISVPPEEIAKRDVIIRQLEEKNSMLQSELKNAKLEILKSENVKMEFADYKSSMQEFTKIQKENQQEMHERFKQATTTLFQPVRLLVNTDLNTSSASGTISNNVKLYDRALRHLAELLNKLSYGLSDTLVETLGVILSLHDLKLEKVTEAQFKAGLATVKQQLERQQSDALSNIGQVRGTLTIFEGVFKDYNEILKNSQQPKPTVNGNIEALTAALLARGQDLQKMEAEMQKLRSGNEDTEHMRVQLDIYRSDFLAERHARQEMASEKDGLQTDLRKMQKRNEMLTKQLEEVRRLNPGIYRSATSMPSQGATTKLATATATGPPNTATTGNMVYKCPKCMRFSSDQMRVMEDHLDFCLDDF